MLEQPVEVNGRMYPIEIHYEHRHSSRVSIRRSRIIIRIPAFLNRNEMAKEIMRMKIWARNKFQENPERFKPEAQKEYKDSDVIKVGNEEYILKIELKEKESSSARLVGNTIEMAISGKLAKEKQNKHISTLLSRIIARKRLPELERKLHELNQKHFNKPIRKIFFKNMSSRWGSCSEDGNINISTRLLFAPDNVLEAVCIHELAHLTEQNHSDKFWELVEKAMPDYKETRNWLKENGGSCGF